MVFKSCLGAMKLVPVREKVAFPQDASVQGNVGIGQIPTGFGIEVELKITLPGVDLAAAKALLEKAHIVCPYSIATSSNIDVTLTLV